jgi:hypothetical protein
MRGHSEQVDFEALSSPRQVHGFIIIHMRYLALIYSKAGGLSQVF